MQAGQLRHRIAIQTNTPSQDSYGQPVESWATAATVWAAVEMLGGRERMTAQQMESEASVRFRIRRRDVNAQQRVSWDGRIFDIEAITHDPTNRRETVLLCSEVQDV
jgi:SPP1 family predicted phage head-tail adaptor